MVIRFLLKVTEGELELVSKLCERQTNDTMKLDPD